MKHGREKGTAELFDRPEMLRGEPAEQACPAAGCLDEDAPTVRGVTPAADEPDLLAAINEPDSALMLNLELFGQLRDRELTPRRPADKEQ